MDNGRKPLVFLVLVEEIIAYPLQAIIKLVSIALLYHQDTFEFLTGERGTAMVHTLRVTHTAGTRNHSPIIYQNKQWQSTVVVHSSF